MDQFQSAAGGLSYRTQAKVQNILPLAILVRGSGPGPSCTDLLLQNPLLPEESASHHQEAVCNLKPDTYTGGGTGSSKTISWCCWTSGQQSKWNFVALSPTVHEKNCSLGDQCLFSTAHLLSYLWGLPVGLLLTF